MPASAFPAEAHYVALGHLHRRQTLPARARCSTAARRSRSTSASRTTPTVVCLVEATPTTPAKVTDMPITAGRRLRTVHGTVAETRPGRRISATTTCGSTCASRPGRAARGRSPTRCRTRWRCASTRSSPRRSPRPRPTARPRGPPGELFAEFCADRGVVDPRVQSLFAQLHDELTTSADAARLSRRADAPGPAGHGRLRRRSAIRRRRLHRRRLSSSWSARPGPASPPSSTR